MKHFSGLYKFVPSLLLVGTVIGTTMTPREAQADRLGNWFQHQAEKNDWRNLAYLGAGVAIIGLVSHNDYLVGAGVAGGLYSAYRYDEDRKSQDPDARRRFAFYSQPTVTFHGEPYHRVTVDRGGQRFYAFKRGASPAPARTHKVRR